MGDQNPQDFAEKVLQSLKKSNRAVDLSGEPEIQKSEQEIQAQSVDFRALGQPSGSGGGPGSGGNKDIVIIPGYGGAAATSVSQINFYWSAPATPDSTGVDTNVRATIYNYATTATQPVLAFGGYDGTTLYKPFPNYGGGTGATAKIWIYPTLGRMDADYMYFNIGTGATNDNGALYYDSAGLRLRFGLGSGTAKTIAYTDDIPTVAAVATTAASIYVSVTDANATHYPLFVNATNAPGLGASTDTNLSYNPSSNTLTVGTVSAAFTGNLTGFATTAYSVNVTSTDANATHYITFVNATAGAGLGQSTDTNLTYNPSSNTLTAGAFSGPLTGNVTGNVTGFATTAQSVNVSAAATNATHYVTFTTATSGAGLATSADTQLTYNPSTDTLSSTNISATTVTASLTGNVTGNVTGFATTSTSVNVNAGAANAAHYLTFVTATSGAGLAVSADGQLSYNPSTDTLSSTNISATTVTASLTGNVTGFATTAQSTNVTTTNANATHYLTFVNASAGAGLGQSTDTDLTYNPSSNTLSAGAFSGPLTGNVTGNVTGFATTAASINVNAGAAAANHYVLFTQTQTGAGVALSTDSTLLYNPNTDTLTATNFSGSFSGTISGVASTANNVGLQAGATNATHYLVFSALTNTAAGAGAALSTDSTVTLNPSNNAMSLGTGNLTANGVIVGSASNTINTSSGNLTIDSNGGTTNITDNVIVTGNLTVQGTTITVDSTVSTIVDPIIVIGSGAGGTHSTLDDNKDRGIEFRWSNSGTATTGFFGFDDSTGKFTFIPNGTNTSEVFSGTAGTAVFFAVEATLQGNSSGTAATYTNFYGTLTGNVTGNISGFANTAYSTSVTSTDANATHYITFVNATSGAGLGHSTDTSLTYNPSSNTLTAGAFSGPLTGNVTGNVTGFATTAQSVNISAGAANATHYVTFSTGTSGAGLAISADTQLTYNPSTDTLSSTNISATTVTASLTGNVTGNVTGFATTAQSVNVVAAATNATHYITFTTGTSGAGLATSADTQLTYNPSTDTLSSTNISATTVTASLTGNVTGNVSGFANTAYSTNVTSTDANATHYITFVNASSGAGLGQSTDTGLTYNPSTNILTAGTFSGSITGNVTGFATTAQSVNVSAAATNATHYITFTTATSGAGLATSADTQLTYNPSTDTLSSTNISATTVTASLTGNVTGNVTGFATTAQSVNVSAAATNATHYITFTTATSGAGLATSADTQLTYNPSTDTLSSTNISATTVTASLTGNVTGNVTGFATTAQSVNVNTAAAATAHYLLMTTGTSGAGLAVSTDSALSYVPSTDTLTVTNVSPVTVSSTSALTNGTYLTIKTNATDDSTTSDFFIRGLTSADVSKFSVDANGNLRATTKSFDIEHPTKPGMRLVYGVLEGPEHGVYHRGTVEGKGNLLVELPDYWSELVLEDFTISLTPHGNYGVHIVEKSKNSFIIAANTNFLNRKLKHIKVDFTVIGSRKDAPLVVEQEI